MEHNFDNLKGVSVDNELEFQVDQTPGALLLAARKAQHLSQADVAERLHLSAHVIKDLEDDDYSHFSAQIYVLGHLRSYSRLLGLEPADVIASYKKIYVDPLGTEIPSIDLSLEGDSIGSIKSQMLFKWASWLVAIMMVVLVFSWWHGQTTHHAANIEVQVASATLPVDEVTASHKRVATPASKPQAVPVSVNIEHSDASSVQHVAKPVVKSVSKPKKAEPSDVKPPLTPNYKVVLAK